MARHLGGGSAQLRDGGRGEDGLSEGIDELAQQSPRSVACQAAGAQRGESSNSSTMGSSTRMSRRCARIYDLAEFGWVPGGPFNPMRLLRRLKASSISHREHLL